MKKSTLIFFALVLFACKTSNNDNKNSLSNGKIANDSIINFNPYDRSIVDLSEDISFIIDSSGLELKKYLTIISKNTFDSAFLKISNKPINTSKNQTDSCIYTSYSRICFSNRYSSGDDEIKYTIIGYNTFWNSYIINSEQYAGSSFFVIENNKYKITKIKGEKPYISNDNKLFLSFYVIEEGLGYIYQIFKNDSGNIVNLCNFWSSSDFIPQTLFFSQNQIFIEIVDYKGQTKYYKMKSC